MWVVEQRSAVLGASSRAAGKVTVIQSAQGSKVHPSTCPCWNCVSGLLEIISVLRTTSFFSWHDYTSELPAVSQAVTKYSAVLVQSYFCPRAVPCAALWIWGGLSLPGESPGECLWGNISSWELLDKLRPQLGGEGRCSLQGSWREIAQGGESKAGWTASDRVWAPAEVPGSLVFSTWK